MSRTQPSLQKLARKGSDSGAPGGASVPRPPSRWVLRYALPLVIVLIATGLLAYAARDALMPAIEVDVMPVVAKPIGIDAGDGGERGDAGDERDPPARPLAHASAQSGGPREPAVIAQAPGWIEPDPFAVTVQALISGVVEDVLVLECDRVEQGQVVARLIADDAKLALRRAQAELLERQAAVERAKADLAAAEARLAELDDDISRKRGLVDVGGVSPGEFARLEHRRRSVQSDVEAARAAVRQHEAAHLRQHVAVDEAALMLERTVIRAPVAGVVMTRSVVPGTRIAIAGDGVGEQHFPGIVRLYDPARLQVRADVPLTDAAKVGIGAKARITTEALPDRVFTGEVTRIVHQADVQRNTVQVKVRIDDPSPLMKPDMLARVRFVAATRSEDFAELGTPNSEFSDGSLQVFAPSPALVQRNGDRASVWVIELGRDGRSHHAAMRELTLGHEADGMILVRRGLRPGDRLIVDPPASIKPGSRVRIRRDNTAIAPTLAEGF
jgi:HlyD family secretion protein